GRRRAGRGALTVILSPSKGATSRPRPGTQATEVHHRMKPQAALAAVAALTVALTATIAPAFAARGSYVVDDAHMLSAGAVSQINQQIASFNASTGKEVVVVTTPSLNGTTPEAAVERSF